MAKDKGGHGSEAKGHSFSGMTSPPPLNSKFGRTNKVKVSVSRPIEYKMVDVGPGGKHYNVQKSSGWKD